MDEGEPPLAAYLHRYASIAVIVKRMVRGPVSKLGPAPVYRAEHGVGVSLIMRDASIGSSARCLTGFGVARPVLDFRSL